MAIDTPARLAVLGAGPVGLEAALYARFLGYDVVVYERGDVANSVRRSGHVRLFAPFSDCHTTLGLAAIQAQDERYQPPPADAILTGQEWIDLYLVPLATTDLLSDHLRRETTVVAVGKEELSRGDLLGNPDRGDWSFRVLSVDAAGQEQVELFDGVLDCTGVRTTPHWLGHGGIPAIGERKLADQIEHGLPDILGAERGRYAGMHTLLVGSGMSAATNVVVLAELAHSEPETRVTWVTRREGPAAAGGPVTVLENDPLPERASLARQANALAKAGRCVTWCPRTLVEEIQRDAAGQWAVILSGEHTGVVQADHVLASVGFRPDYALCQELHVATEELAHSQRASPDLLSGEPNYYVLGSKSYGRRQAGYVVSRGYEQIRDAFKIIGDRTGLDLYESSQRLVR